MQSNLAASVKKIPQHLLEELDHALSMVKSYGSIELFVQDSKITQITVRNIKKTKVDLGKNNKSH